MGSERGIRDSGRGGEDADHAAQWAQWVEPLEADDWLHRELRLGFDTRARLLETIVLVFENGNELVIHAMPARKHYLDLLP